MSNVAVVGLDLGKSTFHLVGLDAKGKRIFAKMLSRKQLFVFTANLPSCLIGMETCCGAHAVARKLISQGHDARLIPGQYVTPYVKTMKNDFIDAEAIAEAAQRAHMRFVPVKTEEQLDLQALHRVRERLIGRRTCLINQVRGFLLDRGFAVSNGRSALEKRVPLILEEAENTLTPRMRQLLFDLRLEWREIDARLSQITAEIEQIARQQDSQHRRFKGFGYMQSRLLILDFVPDNLSNTILEDEAAKVDFFAVRCGIHAELLPRGWSGRVVLFPDGYPIFVSPDGVPRFTFFEDGSVTLTRFERDLAQYRPLFSALPAFELVYLSDVAKSFSLSRKLQKSFE